MIYRVIGILCSNLPAGIDMCFVEFNEIGGKWNYDILATEQYVHPGGWKSKLENAANISVLEYQLLHAGFGHYIGELVNDFISKNGLDLRVHLIALQGHSVFHLTGQALTAQLGSGAGIAAATKLPVVSDLRAMDLAFGGQGLPIAAIGQKLLPSLENTAPFPETLNIALMGVLRWREEANMLSTVTGASRNSIGGALWLGTEA